MTTVNVNSHSISIVEGSVLTMHGELRDGKLILMFPLDNEDLVVVHTG